MENVRAHVRIRGRVQGVFFRASTRDAASVLGVRGWVRNTFGGDVEAVLEGDRDNVERLIAWCRRGPAGARVTGADIQWEPYEDEFVRFEIRF